MAKKEKTSPTAPLLAYANPNFLESADARGLRILSEYIDPLAHFHRAGVQHTVVFFGSARICSREDALSAARDLKLRSKDGASKVTQAGRKHVKMLLSMSRYYEEARELSKMITSWGMALHKSPRFLMVCSGGGPGIMEAANRGASEAGGKSIGLNIKLPMEQQPNPYISSDLSFLFRYFFMRKLWFAQPAQALIVFPGGFGTMDEMFEILTLVQTNKMHRRVNILLYGSKYWKKAINFKWLVDSGTISSEDMNLIEFADTPARAFQILKGELSQRLGIVPITKRRFF